MTLKNSAGSMITSMSLMVSHTPGTRLMFFAFLQALPVTISKLQGDVVGMHGRLTVREHCELAVAYRRILLSHRAKLQASAGPGCESACSRTSIVNEMHRVCAEFLETVSRRLLPVSKTGEEIVYCWTMYVSAHCCVVA